MKRLLTQNSKLKKTSEITGIKTYDFALPALKTCPKAGACRSFCYASKGAYLWPAAKNKHAENFERTKKVAFIHEMCNEIDRFNIEAVRIHSSGDFYSAAYLNKWLKIIKAMPDVTFYAYTKSLHLFQGLELPPNFTVIYSFGGKLDHLIDVKKDRHAIVYDETLPDGYSYANDNDHVALARNKKIGLKKH